MLMITELLTQTPGPLWRLVKQAGINHVVTLLDGGDEVLGLVVDGAVGAELEAGVGFFLRSHGDDHLGAKGLGQLYRHGADAG